MLELTNFDLHTDFSFFPSVLEANCTFKVNCVFLICFLTVLCIMCKYGIFNTCTDAHAQNCTVPFFFVNKKNTLYIAVVYTDCIKVDVAAVGSVTVLDSTSVF